MLVFLIGEPRFPLGNLAATSNAISRLDPADISKALLRHGSGDWGEVNPEDRLANDEALLSEARLQSAYKSHDGVPFWIITEADRSATTVLLPEDY